MSLDLSVQALHAAYLAGTLTPEVLVDEVVRRCDSCEDPAIWISRLSREQIQPYLDALAGQGPDSLPLYGIPFAIKDNIDLAGLPTTAACPDYAYSPERSAFVVERLIEAGAIPIGKTNLDQFATGLVGTRSPYGAVRNSFNPDYISGGSSSGSAVAVARGLASFSLGTDTAGSGRIPAAFNNLVGIKPTRGLLSTRGVVPACRTLDCVSIFACALDDAERVMRVAACYDAQDPFARPAQVSGPAWSAFRFGVPDRLEWFGDGDSERLYREAVARLQAQGGEAVEIDFAPFLDAARLLYEGPWVAERFAAIEGFIRSRPEALHPVTRAIIEPARDASAIDAFKAQYRLAELKRRADTVLADLDFILTPTAGTIFRIAEVEADPIRLNSQLGHYTNFMNLLDYAGIAVPAGFGSNGLPYGVTLFGPAFSDPALALYARHLQAMPKAGGRRYGSDFSSVAASRNRADDQARGLRCPSVRATAEPSAHRARRPPGPRRPHRSALPPLCPAWRTALSPRPDPSVRGRHVHRSRGLGAAATAPRQLHGRHPGSSRNRTCRAGRRLLGAGIHLRRICGGRCRGHRHARELEGVYGVPALSARRSAADGRAPVPLRAGADDHSPANIDLDRHRHQSPTGS